LKFGVNVDSPPCHEISSGSRDPDHGCPVTARGVTVWSVNGLTRKKVAVTQKLAEMGSKLLLFTDRNSHMSFQVVSLNLTLSDPEGSNRDFG